MLAMSSPVIRSAMIGTPIGPLTILTVDDRVRAAGFTEDVGALLRPLAPSLRGLPVETVLDLGSITDALTAYFDGDLAAIDAIPVSPRGSDFQERVWAALRTIPSGQPTTYGELAIRLGGKQLARAVGTANATNPIALIIPCHRLIGSDGRLRGYYWALDRKRWLLDHERRHADRFLETGSTGFIG